MGSSSKTTRTTGAVASTAASEPAWASDSNESLSSGELTRKSTRKSERRGREHGQERAHALRSRVGERERGSGGDCERDREPGGEVRRAFQRLERDQRGETSAKREVQRLLGAGVDSAGKGLGREQERRRDEEQPERERDDVPGGRVADDEELGRVPEQVEERLRDGERREDEEVQAADRDPLGAVEANVHEVGSSLYPARAARCADEPQRPLRPCQGSDPGRGLRGRVLEARSRSRPRGSGRGRTRTRRRRRSPPSRT